MALQQSVVSRIVLSAQENPVWMTDTRQGSYSFQWYMDGTLISVLPFLSFQKITSMHWLVHSLVDILPYRQSPYCLKTKDSSCSYQTFQPSPVEHLNTLVIPSTVSLILMGLVIELIALSRRASSESRLLYKSGLNSKQHQASLPVQFVSCVKTEEGLF